MVGLEKYLAEMVVLMWIMDKDGANVKCWSSTKVLPILVLLYILIEYCNHNSISLNIK